MKTADEGAPAERRPRTRAEIDVHCAFRVGEVLPFIAALDAFRDEVARAERARGRLEGLEEAAKIADEHVGMGTGDWAWKAATLIRDRIRALSSEQPGAAAPSGTSGDAGKLERAVIPGTSNPEER
jgi:hypothetical protein